MSYDERGVVTDLVWKVTVMVLSECVYRNEIRRTGYLERAQRSRPSHPASLCTLLPLDGRRQEYT